MDLRGYNPQLSGFDEIGSVDVKEHLPNGEEDYYFHVNGSAFQIESATLSRDTANPSAPWVLDVTLYEGETPRHSTVNLNGVSIASDASGYGFMAKIEGLVAANGHIGDLVTQSYS